MKRSYKQATRPKSSRKTAARDQLSDELLRLTVQIHHDELLERCRNDINVFIEYVFGIKQHPFHRRLQALANKHQYLCIDAPIEHGKTFSFSVARPLWLLGRDPNQTIAIVGNATENPQACLDVIRQQIENNSRLHEVFPDLRLRKATQEQLIVDRGITTDKDPSLVAIGVNGSIIGRRWSGLVLDDFCDFQNTWTIGERRKLWTIIESTILGRVLQNGWVVDIGTPWAVDDARHQLRKLPGWHFERFDATQGLWPETYTDPKTGKMYGWPAERLEMKRRQMSALEFDRQFRCLATSASMAIFSREAIERCLEAGRGLALGRPPGDGDIVLTGVDLAIKKKDTADRTSFFTGAINDGRKTLLDLQCGKWEITDVARKFVEIVRRYDRHAGFRVETNAAQAWLLQVLDNPDLMKSPAIGATEQDLQRIKVFSHQTTQRKYDEQTGIRGMAVDFEQERWTIPCSSDGVPHEDVQDWIDGLVTFDPTSHTNDNVMSSWLFTEQARRYWRASGSGTWARYGLL